jgi:hypothetical protein
MSTLEKAIPCALVKLSINISKKIDNIHNRDVELEIGTWYLLRGDLINFEDERAVSIPEEDRLPLILEKFISAF